MILNPLHWSYQAWQWFFVIAGCWNLLGAVDAILRPALNLEKYYGVQTDDFITIFLNRAFWIVVLIFGIGYFLIAINPILFYGIIVLGIIGKIAVAVSWIYLFKIGKGERISIFAASGDLLFTVFFLLCLFSDIMNT